MSYTFGNAFVYDARFGNRLATGDSLLRYGVLGLLIERRGYGYDLVQRLSGRLGAAWQLNPSAVYTALDQLEESRLIETVAAALTERPRAARRSRRQARVVYQATENGVAEFQAWLARPTERIDPIRSELQLKVALAGPEDVPPLLASIAHEEWLIGRRLHEERRALAEDGQAPTVAHREPSEPGNGAGAAEVGNGWPRTTMALVSAAATARLESELAWLQSVRETLQRLSAAQIGSAAHAGIPKTAKVG